MTICIFVNFVKQVKWIVRIEVLKGLEETNRVKMTGEDIIKVKICKKVNEPNEILKRDCHETMKRHHLYA